MRDEINIGSVPADEDCVQLGNDGYQKWSKLECYVLAMQLRRVHGDEPNGAKLYIKSNPHDFGTYYELACKYDDDNSDAIEYAFECENVPENWDAESIKALKEAGYPLVKDAFVVDGRAVRAQSEPCPQNHMLISAGVTCLECGESGARGRA